MARIAPKAIFFDYGNTLVEDTTDKYGDIDRYVQSIGYPALTREQFDAAWGAAEAFTGKYRSVHGKRTWKKDRFWYTVCREFLVAAFGEDAAAHAETMHATQFFTNTIYPDTIGTLEELKRRGYRLGVISNWDAPTLHENFERFGMTKYFDHILPSYEAEANKPHPHIFEVAMNALGVAPADSMHVGDSYGCDVMGAIGVGATPVWIDRDEDTPAGKPEGLIEIRTLGDLLGIVE